MRRLPLVRADCPDRQDGPCPYVSCRHHLFLDVDALTGSIKLNFPDLVDEDGTPILDAMPATCALDVAEAGGVILMRMGELLNLTRERARQIEEAALERLRKRLVALGCTEPHRSTHTEGPFDSPYADDEH
jgi:hypothetical protein